MIIFNEEKYCEDLLTSTSITLFSQSDTNLLARYMRHHGLPIEEIRSALMQYLLSHTSATEANIQQYANRAVKDLKVHRLRSNDNVIIWQEEIDKINKLQTHPLRRLMFSILFISKFMKYNTNRVDSDSANYDSLYCKANVTDIFKGAKMSEPLEVKMTLLHRLYMEGYIEATYNGGIKVLIEKKDGTDKDTKYEIRPTPEFAYFLDSLTKNNILLCPVCGAWFKRVKKIRNAKYCSQCQEDVRKKQSAERAKAYRKRLASRI